MRIALIGPTYPFRGGIAHYTTLLAQAIRREDELLFCSFKRQYPRFLFPGQVDREPGERLLDISPYYGLDPLNPISWWQTAHYIQRWQPDLIILQWWVPFWAPAWFTLSRLLRSQARIVFLCHNVLPHENNPGARLIARIVLKGADGFVVHAVSEKKRLSQLLPQATIEINPIPTYQALKKAPLTPSQARTALGLTETEPVMLFFGFVRLYKGLDILIEAMSHLPPELPTRLLVVGEFWLSETEIRARIEDLGLQERIHIINRYVPNEAIGQYFVAADVVVLPYRTATQSAVAQLAFGFERPVITTRVGGLAEAVQDGQTGYIVPPNDSHHLAQAIEKFFRLNEQERTAMRRRIRQTAPQFGWSHMVKALKRAGKVE